MTCEDLHAFSILEIDNPFGRLGLPPPFTQGRLMIRAVSNAGRTGRPGRCLRGRLPGVHVRFPRMDNIVQNGKATPKTFPLGFACESFRMHVFIPRAALAAQIGIPKG